MSTILSQEQPKELSTKEKLLIIAETLRNNNGITQIQFSFNDGTSDHFCAMGLLGFRSGIPINILNGIITYELYDRITQRYGFKSYRDLSKTLGFSIPHKNDGFPLIASEETKSPSSIRRNSYSFDEIADLIEERANSL